MKLSIEDLEKVAISVQNYLKGKAYVVDNEIFDSVSDGDVGFTFKKEAKTKLQQDNARCVAKKIEKF